MVSENNPPDSGHGSPDPPTSAEDAGMPPVQQSRSNRRIRHVERSCSLCHRRKVRCDKQQPCARCVRGGHTCFYPQAVQPLRRIRKTTIADVASRISDLEKTLVAVSGEAIASTASAAVSTASPEAGSVGVPVISHNVGTAPSSARTERNPGDEILVQKGGSNHYYFDEVLISRVIDEEHDIQSVLATPDHKPSQPTTPSPFNPMGILSSPSFAQPISAFHPPKQAAMQLWKTFVDYIDIGIKVLHVPTDEILVYTAIDDPQRASPENLALCFAVYYVSTVAMEESQTGEILPGNRIYSLQQFKLGFEQSFALADFLENPTVTLLKALAIYLSALRVNNPGRSIWTLNGLTIRAAQSIGLHRDGKKLGLPPFETEMRRRLWWFLIGRDARAAEDYGLQSINCTGLASDVGVPLNLDDSDLYPEMKELPPPRTGWTRMVLSLANHQVMRAWSQASSIAASVHEPPTEEARLKVIGSLKECIGQYLQMCNPVIPQQRLVYKIISLVSRKLEIVTRHQWRTLQGPGARQRLATEEDLLEALDFLESSLDILEDELCQPYKWFVPAYPQYHILLYALWHLCVCPEGPNVERAWRTVNIVFEQVQTRHPGLGAGSKWTVFQALKSKAMAIRQKTACASGAQERVLYPLPSGTNELPETAAPGADPVQAASSEAIGWYGDLQSIPDWDTLLQGFELDRYDFGSFK